MSLLAVYLFLQKIKKHLTNETTKKNKNSNKKLREKKLKNGLKKRGVHWSNCFENNYSVIWIWHENKDAVQSD